MPYSGPPELIQRPGRERGSASFWERVSRSLYTVCSSPSSFSNEEKRGSTNSSQNSRITYAIRDLGLKAIKKKEKKTWMHPVEATVLERLRLTAKMRILEGGGGGGRKRAGREDPINRSWEADCHGPKERVGSSPPSFTAPPESFSHTWANYPESRSR